MICYLNKSEGKEEWGVFSALVDKKLVKNLEADISKDVYFDINDRMFEGVIYWMRMQSEITDDI